MTKIKCRNCKEGYMHEKEGKFGKFLACDQYPECQTTEKVANTMPVEKNQAMNELGYIPTPKVKKVDTQTQIVRMCSLKASVEFLANQDGGNIFTLAEDFENWILR